ncbi:type II toxin-antitoxin system RelE/ParE family toxin [Candidatus Poribacteria bacterium]|nr:type II toxin-antitoxin system RelE/ParE family toxin [Candidatus Poribacteria bacterium]
MREIVFYRFESGRCPVEEFLSSLTVRQRKKVLFVLQLIEELDRVPQEYFKKLRGADDIWEVRVQHGNNIFRLLGFFDSADVVVLNHAFTKKTQKTPRPEIRIAEQRKQDYHRRKQ